MTHTTAASDDDAHRADLEALRAIVAAQADDIAALRARLDGRASAGPGSGTSPQSAATTTRRGLVTKGTVAAGAAMGGLLLATSTPAAAASGAFDGNPAVDATSSAVDGVGVWGKATATTGEGYGVSGTGSSPAGAGVLGLNLATSGSAAAVGAVTMSDEGIAVWGRSFEGNSTSRAVYGEVGSSMGVGVDGEAHATTGTTAGVRGTGKSSQGVGVLGSSPGVGVAAHSTRAQLRLSGAAASPLLSGAAYVAGELVFDDNEDLWLCVAPGTSGLWRRISGPATAGALVVLPTPVRVYDSRPGGRPPEVGPKSPLTPGTPRPVDLTVGGGVPAGATAAVVNLVATGAVDDGFLSIYRDGIAWPGTSNVNFGDGQTVGVTTLTALDPDARCLVRANVGTDVVVDVLGYHR